MINHNKGFFAFGMVLFFLFAGLSKSFAGTKSIKSHTKKEQSVSVIIAEGDETKYDELKAFDYADDFELECTFFGEDAHGGFFEPVEAQKTAPRFTLCKDVYTVPLYDLFCNWKFHLS